MLKKIKSKRSFISTAGTKVSLISKSPISIIEMTLALRPGLCGSIGFLQLKYHVREKTKAGLCNVTGRVHRINVRKHKTISIR